jgi:hypothetical protein
MNIDAIKRFVARISNNTVDKLAELFAPKVVGFYNVKNLVVFRERSLVR